LVSATIVLTLHFPLCFCNTSICLTQLPFETLDSFTSSIPNLTAFDHDSLPRSMGSSTTSQTAGGIPSSSIVSKKYNEMQQHLTHRNWKARPSSQGATTSIPSAGKISNFFRPLPATINSASCSSTTSSGYELFADEKSSLGKRHSFPLSGSQKSVSGGVSDGPERKLVRSMTSHSAFFVPRQTVPNQVFCRNKHFTGAVK